MAYAVDWIGKVITIPTSDLVLVSGTRYQLPMSDFLGEIRRLEAAFDQGLWAPQILEHANPRLDFVGTNYVGFDEILNSYQIQFTGVATRIDLIGTNNDIVDVLIPTGIAVVPSNSAGLQKVQTGGGLSPTQDQRIKDVWDIIRGKNVINRTTGRLEVYDEFGVLLYTAPLYEDAAGTTPVGPDSERADRRDRLA